MTAYFISDVHLGLGNKEKEKAKEDRLIGFLKSVLPSANALFIVGDLFDFWFEYATVIPRGYHRTLAALQEFTDRTIPVHFLTGNHDCWTNDFLEKELGLHVYHQPFDITIDGKRLHLHHGDGLARNDLGYRMIKPILRNRLSIFLYRWLHPDIGVRIARRSSRTSRDYTAQKVYSEEGMIEYARRRIGEGADLVIMGHRHKANILPVGNGLYVNLGDWISLNTYGELTDGVMRLKTWNPN
jgi:UDP-2,3-diacylglucosamine hydrolase